MKLPAEAQVFIHYQAYWGDPIQVMDFPLRAPRGKVFIGEYRLERDGWSGIAYGTIGVCQHPMVIQSADPDDTQEGHMELVAYSNSPQVSLVESLAGLAAYPFEHRTFLGVGHRVPGIKPVAAGASMTDFLFLPPLLEAEPFRYLHLDNVTHVDILWAVPIYTSERLFARVHGWHALVERLADDDIDPADFSRKPVV